MSTRLRMLVTGGRDYSPGHKPFIHAVLGDYRGELELLIQGGARGVDTIVQDWAARAGVPCLTVEAAWSAFGSQAGPIRNEWMFRYGLPDIVLAFPGGRGTWDVITKAQKRGMMIIAAGDWEPLPEGAQPFEKRQKRHK